MKGEACVCQPVFFLKKGLARKQNKSDRTSKFNIDTFRLLTTWRGALRFLKIQRRASGDAAILR